MEFTFITALSDDLINAYATLANTVIGKVHSIGFTKELDYPAAKQFLSQKIHVPRASLLMVYEGDNLIGTGYVSPSGYETTKHYCEISKVMVDPNTQGKGIGKQIMQQLEEKARQLDYTHALLDTWDVPSIVAFYEKCGYTIVGKIPDFVFYKGKFHDSYYLAKKLDQ